MQLADRSARRFMMTRIGKRVGLALLVLATLIGTTFVTSQPAYADADANDPINYILENWATGLCLDSNDDGLVYTLACNGGRNQVWISRGDGRLANDQTSLCLDSNVAGEVYTRPCSFPNDYQSWEPLFSGWTDWQFQNRSTGMCLDSASDHRVYTLGCNRGGNQNWVNRF